MCHRPLVIVVLLSAALVVKATDATPRYLALLNRAHDSVTSVQVAASGTDAFEPRAIDTLAGGGGGTTLRLGDSGCRFDLRLEFRDGRRAIYRDVDVCKGDTLVIAPLPAR